MSKLVDGCLFVDYKEHHEFFHDKAAYLAASKQCSPIAQIKAGDILMLEKHGYWNGKKYIEKAAATYVVDALVYDYYNYGELVGEKF